MCGKNVRISVGQYGKVVPFNVHKRQDDVFPSIDKEELEVFLGAVGEDGICSVYSGENDVVEEGLECGDRSPLVDEEGGECICCCDAESEDLSVL